MLELRVEDSTKITDIPIMPERFNTITEPVSYPIVHPFLTSITRVKNYN